MTTTLILIAHGSRNPRSNDEVCQLCTRLSAQAAVTEVVPAFLELAEPTLEATVRQVAASGASRILVLPYFLNSGRHVTEDVPALVEQARLAHPDMRIELLPHVGGTQPFLSALEAIITEQMAQVSVLD